MKSSKQKLKNWKKNYKFANEIALHMKINNNTHNQHHQHRQQQQRQQQQQQQQHDTQACDVIYAHSLHLLSGDDRSVTTTCVIADIIPLWCMQHFLLSPLTNPITSYLLSPLLFTCYHQRHSRSRNNDVTIASPTHSLSHTITHIPLTSLYHLLSPAICYHLLISPGNTSATVVVATTTSSSRLPEGL